MKTIKYAAACLVFVLLSWGMQLGSASASDYYVRPDGGTAAQCTGLTDAPHEPGSESMDCAWSHPFYALEGTEPPSWKIQGGDTVLIYPGSYRMGYGAPNTGWCAPEYPWDCRFPPLPSGPDAEHPTRILGAGWDQGCPQAPELWGTERTYYVLDLDGVSHAQIQCLELTDHSGCGETYPDEAPHSCWGQSAGGYGDGFGTGQTGGHWIFRDSVFRYNTSDGLDLLYVREPGTQIDIKRSRAYSNAGDQFKTSGPVSAENCLAVSECSFFEQKSFTYHVDNCRSGGSAFSVTLGDGDQASLVHSTAAGEGDVLLLVECEQGESCDDTGFSVLNNIFMEYQEFLDPSDLSTYVWYEPGVFGTRMFDYNLVYSPDGALRLGNVSLSENDINQDPQHYTVPAGYRALIYGTSTSNTIVLESGAQAELLYFPGYNTVQILSDSNLFTVFRSGAFVTFQGPDGTVLKIPASTTVQNIVFNDRTLTLMIAVNQIYLDDQVIGADGAPIQSDLQCGLCL